MVRAMKDEQAVSGQDRAYADWDDRREQRAAVCDERLGWLLSRHADILRALRDHKTFSNRVSHHLSVPNGMDPPEHTPYRKLIEPYFNAERMAAFEPVCRAIAADLVARAVSPGPAVEIVSAIGQPFAARVQCSFLGWPRAMEQALLDWAACNARAIRNQDRAELAANAHRFEDLIEGQMQARRDAGTPADADLTCRLMAERVGDRALLDEEIVSILRNWTAGEIGTIAASVGVLARSLAEWPDVQDAVRKDRSRIPYAVDEILRIRGPLLTNRRVTTCPVHVGGTELPAGARATIVWVAGNRDGRAFEDPLAFRWDRDPKAHLLYGAGIHVCPGAPLARMELRLMVEALLDATSRIAAEPGCAPTPAEFPGGGYAAVPLRLER